MVDTVKLQAKIKKHKHKVWKKYLKSKLKINCLDKNQKNKKIIYNSQKEQIKQSFRLSKKLLHNSMRKNLIC
jgi:hypothetical protein